MPSHSRITGWDNLWRWSLCLAAGLLTVGQLVPDRAAPRVELAAGVLAFTGVLIGVLRYRPASARPWFLLTSGVGVAVVASAGRSLHAAWLGSGDVLSAPSDVLALAAALLLVAGLGSWIGRAPGQPRSDGLVDVGMVVCGLGAASWDIVGPPLYGSAGSAGDVSQTLGWVIDLVLAAMAVRLMFGASVRSPSHALLVSATFLLLLADVIEDWWPGQAGPAAGPAPELVRMAAYLTFAASALHPSMTTSAGGPERIAAVATRSRLGFYVFVNALGPAVILMELALHGWQINGRDVAIPVALTAVAEVLLVMRLGPMARVAHARALGLVAQAVALGESLQEQEMLQDELSYQALHDPLTGLGNRMLLYQRLEQTVNGPATAAQHGLLLLDLDGFKDVNDTFGHPVGDALLVEVARRLLEVVRPGTVLARLGGDEFAVLAEGADDEGTVALAMVALDAVRQTYLLEGREICLSASVGVLANRQPILASEALRKVDLALYAAKAAGKNQFALYTAELSVAQRAQTQLATGLRHAIANEEFTLHYQPIVNLRTGRVVAVEALLRWQPANSHAIPPNEFIPLAERSGLIGEIGSWVLRQACKDARGWHDRYGISVTVNVSPGQLRAPEFAALIPSTLADTGLPAHALVLEITETILVGAGSAGTGQTIDLLRSLRTRGVEIAIDDFGTGYSSLAYLRHLPVDILKIDGAFTAEILVDESAFTSVILQLGGSLGLRAIAEAVESEEQAERLRHLGCELAQGFHFSRPVPAENIDTVLANRNTDAEVEMPCRVCCGSRL